MLRVMLVAGGKQATTYANVSACSLLRQSRVAAEAACEAKVELTESPEVLPVQDVPTKVCKSACLEFGNQLRAASVGLVANCRINKKWWRRVSKQWKKITPEERQRR